MGYVVRWIDRGRRLLHAWRLKGQSTLMPAALTTWP